MRRLLALLAIALLSTVGILAAPAAAQENPHKCFEVTDGNGNPIYTVCVPWFLPDPPQS